MQYLYLVFLLTLFLSFFLFHIEKKDSPSLFIRNVIFTSCFSFVTSLLFIRFVFSKTIFIIQTNNGYIIYNIILLILSFCLTFIIFNIKSQIQIKQKNKRDKWKKIVVIFFKILVSSLFIIGLSILLALSWSIDFYGELTPEQFLYNMSSSTKGTNKDVIDSILHTPLFFILCLSIIFLLFLFTHLPHKINLKDKLILKWSYIRTTMLSFIAITTLIFGLNYGAEKNYVDVILNSFFKNSSYIQDNYIDPNEIEFKFPNKKRNLIHIYAKSLESSFLSKDLGGYMNENLMPNLTAIAKENIHFSNNDNFGGWNQTYASSWSIAGIVNMENGIPLKLTIDGNSYGKEGTFLPGVTNIGDILNKQGYNQTVMMGSDASFAGRDVYFKEHGNYSIFDVKEAREKKLIPEDYNVWWGFEDDKLYEFAKSELTHLNNLGNPFHFSMITADTHFPDGYLSTNIERKRESQYADVIAYSDQQISTFLKWIQEQPFYENTTIVITGDHLSMDKTFFETFSSDYQRRPFNLFMNLPFQYDDIRSTRRLFSPVDIFPTMIAGLNVEFKGNRLGLGTNLFSNEQTLIERDGLNKFNEELSKYSIFYNQKFLKKKE